jgi:hypothetical protein
MRYFCSENNPMKCLPLIVFALVSLDPLMASPPARFAWQILPAREVRPEGWLRQEWTEDFRVGLPGRLDEINEDVTHRLFARQETEIKFPGRPTWWPGDSETYWREAFVHAAFQVGGKNAVASATRYVEDILKRQSADGYIGIYAPGSRLLPTHDPRYGQGSGELNTQAHVFLTLLAFHEHTGRTDVLATVERAARLTMRTYREGIFGTTGELTPKSGGNSHAIAFADAMTQLYRLTGDESYLAFLRVIYESYRNNPPRDHDLLPTILEDPAARFRGHGAHTAESFHLLPALALHDPAFRPLANQVLGKLARQLTPGGAVISDEMIDGRLGNGHDLYEYCTQAELVKSLTWIAQYTGSTVAAERAARLFLNAVQGARLHPLVALQYLSRDDRLDIPTNPKKEPSNIRNDGSHFQMSSIIRPACCPASGGRPVHYFLSGTWMKRPDGSALALMNFAPTTLTTKIAGSSVRISQQTNYPFADDVTLEFAPEGPVAFDLWLRLPLEGDIKIVSASGVQNERRDGFLVLRKKWQRGDRVALQLDLPVVLEKTQDGAAQYYRRGSLTFGLPFAVETRQVSENPRWTDGKPSGLFEYDITVRDKSAWANRIDPVARFSPVKLDGDPLQPWTKPPLGLRGTMVDPRGREVDVTLVPEGSAVSRRVTFLDRMRSAEEAARVPGGANVSLGL